MDVIWLQRAIQIIKEGLADKLTKDNVTVYKAGKIIRVDIKEE